MPHTINGIGTHYYGKKNVNSYQGVCDSCNRETVMEDYETGYWFVLIFIPLIPLGKRQVVGYCSSCTQHRAVPLDDWNRLKASEINQGMSELAAAGDDPHAALRMIGTLTGFNEHEQAAELAADTEARFPNDVEVQLALGSWHEQRGRAAKADECFKRAYAIDPSHPVALRAEAIDLMIHGRLQEAQALLDQLKPPYDPDVFFLLAKTHQERGEHHDAVRLFDFIKQWSPAFAKEKEFRKADKKSRKMV